MYKGNSFLAIIPARGGSKRLPNKNILELRGEPLIAWTIKASLDAKYLDKIIITSDSDAILKVAGRYDVGLIKRPSVLAKDSSRSCEVVEHAILQLNTQYDYIVLLQPTSPLRTSQHINEAIQLLLDKKADAIISVCEVDHSPLWCNTLPEDGNMCGFLSGFAQNKRSQDLSQYFRLNGAIYICKTENFLTNKSFFLNNCFAYKMDKHQSVDIDDEYDFSLAEVFLNKNRSYSDLYGAL